MSSPNVKPLPFETYLAVIENSEGTKMFKNGRAEVDGQPTDVMKNGELSCAFFVSSVLAMFNVIGRMHATVSSTEKDMETSGWNKVDSPEPGDVVVWEPKLFPSGEMHEHIGFVLDENTAISNDYTSGMPKPHQMTKTPDGTSRTVSAYWRGKHLFRA